MPGLAKRFWPVLMFSMLALSCSSLKRGAQSLKERAREAPRMLWNKNLDPPYLSGNLPIGLAAPFVHEGMVFIGTQEGKMHAYNLYNGRPLWSRDEGAGFHSAPSAFGKNIVYGTVAGRLIARNYLTGQLDYALDVGSSIESPPTFYKGRAFAHLRNHKIVSFDVKTGKILWTYQRSVPFKTTLQRVSTPTVFEGRLYVGFADGYAVSLGIEDGRVLWERKLATGSKFIDVDMTPTFYKGNLYISSLAGKLTLLDPISSSIKRRFNFGPSRRPLFVNDHVLVGTLGGELVKMDGEGEVKARAQLSQVALTSMVVWRKWVVVGDTHGQMFFIDPVTFKQVDSIHLGSTASAVFADLVVSEGHLLVHSSRNRLYVYQ